MRLLRKTDVRMERKKESERIKANERNIFAYDDDGQSDS